MAFAHPHARGLPGELEANQGEVLVIFPAHTRAGRAAARIRGHLHTVLAFGAIRHRAGLGRSRESQIQTGKLRWVAPLLSNALTLLPARGHFTRSRIQLDCHCRRVLGTALPHKRRIKGLPGILRYFVLVSRVKHHIVCADATPAYLPRGAVEPVFRCSRGAPDASLTSSFCTLTATSGLDSLRVMVWMTLPVSKVVAHCAWACVCMYVWMCW